MHDSVLMRHKDNIGKKFGKLTVVDAVHDSRYKVVCYSTQCECGNMSIMSSYKILSGRTKYCLQCGRGRNFKHGMKGTKIYGVWWSMNRRCHDPNSKSYGRYGALGVVVCERWKSFENFFADMGEAPTGMQIDRIAGGSSPYSPENCRWVTPKQNSENRKSHLPRRENSIKDMIGKVFGSFTIVSHVPNDKPGLYYKAICKCGFEKVNLAGYFRFHKNGHRPCPYNQT